MDINGREKAKRFWIVVGLLGICMFVTAIFCFFHTEKNEAEKRILLSFIKISFFPSQKFTILYIRSEQADNTAQTKI